MDITWGPFSEPMTMLTDFFIALQTIYYFNYLGKHNHGQVSRKAWRYAFLALFLTSLAGGITHGFKNFIPEIVVSISWIITLVCIGLIALSFLVGAIIAYTKCRYHKILIGLAILKSLIYFSFIFSGQIKFIFAIIEYLPNLLIVMALSLWAWLSRNDISGKWNAFGVIVSIIAAAIQALKISPSPYFNHNDLYHVVQMLGIYFFYRATFFMLDSVERVKDPQ